MLIIDPKGKYTLKVDHQRRVVFEKNIGLWDAEDVKRYHNDYINKIVPLFKGNKWAKLCNLTEYRTSNIVEEVKVYNEWAEKNGLSCGAIVMDSAITKMQMNRTKVDVNPNSFTSDKEADTWLKSQGF